MATAAKTLRRASAPPHPPVVATSNDGVLPLDLLYEILLRLPTAPLCRFRAVCRSWRCLLCHRDFIAAAHNPGPLLAVGVTDCSTSHEVNVMDVESGDVVKQVNLASNKVPYADMLNMNHDRVICTVAEYNRVRLIDLANDVTCILPHYTPPSYRKIWCMVGRAASTGEHKVLTITRNQEPQNCNILTLGNNNRGWRDAGHPPSKVMCYAGSSPIINGFAYFLSEYNEIRGLDAHKICVFDLNLERWRHATSFHGPLKRCCICLAELNGQLVAGYDSITSIDMWFLEDSDTSRWSKRYTMTIPCYQNLFTHACHVNFVKPLVMLDDGRIVLWMRVTEIWKENEVLWIYDPRTERFSDGIKLPRCSCVSVFAWGLLHPGRRSAIDMAAERLLMGRRHDKSEAPSSIEGSNKKRRTSDLL